MSGASTIEITAAALRLPEQDRLRVASALWQSVGGSEAHLAALARAQELESGKITPQSQAEVFQAARAALG